MGQAREGLSGAIVAAAAHGETHFAGSPASPRAPKRGATCGEPLKLPECALRAALASVPTLLQGARLRPWARRWLLAAADRARARAGIVKQMSRVQ